MIDSGMSLCGWPISQGRHTVSIMLKVIWAPQKKRMNPIIRNQKNAGRDGIEREPSGSAGAQSAIRRNDAGELIHRHRRQAVGIGERLPGCSSEINRLIVENIRAAGVDFPPSIRDIRIVNTSAA